MNKELLICFMRIKNEKKIAYFFGAFTGGKPEQ